jgi:hypothetical protein
MLRQTLSSVGKRALQGVRQFAAAPAVAPDVLVPEPAAWTNSAAVLYGVNDMRFENFPLPERVPSGNVRIEIKAVGICGSDVHYWRKVSSLNWKIDTGFVLLISSWCLILSLSFIYTVRSWDS